MKRLKENRVVILILTTLLSVSSFAQIDFSLKSEKKIKAKKNTYIVRETGYDISYENIVDPYRNVDQGEWRGEWPPLVFKKKDKIKIKNEFIKKVKPYISSNYKDWENTSITIQMKTDMEGNIKTLYFSFPIEMKKMPIYLIEELDCFVSKIQMTFKKNYTNEHFKYMHGIFYIRIEEDIMAVDKKQ